MGNRWAAILGTLGLLTAVLISVDEPIAGAQNGEAIITIGSVPSKIGLVVEDGSAPFDSIGGCPDDNDGDTAAFLNGFPNLSYDHDDNYPRGSVFQPGEDCSPNDGVVRTNDVVVYGYSLGVRDLRLGESVENVVFVQTITPAGGAIVDFVSLPGSCQTENVTPVSEIRTKADGSQTLVCNVGTLIGPSQLIFLRTAVKPSQKSPNGSTFVSSDGACEIDGAATGCQPRLVDGSVGTVGIRDLFDDVATTVSAQPRFDLALDKRSATTPTAIAYPGVDLADESDDELGFFQTWFYTVEADAGIDARGVNSLEGTAAEPITFQNTVYVNDQAVPTGTQVPNFRLRNWGVPDDGCVPNAHTNSLPYGAIGVRSKATGTNSVPDSGSIDCTQSGAGEPIEFSIYGGDYTAANFPAQGGDTTAAGPPYYLISASLGLWIPFADVDRYDSGANCDEADAAAGYEFPFCGDIDGVGSLPLSNCAGGFDPVSSTGVSNYGDGVEPGEYNSGTQSFNNCRSTNLVLRAIGGFSKLYREGFESNGDRGAYVPGQSANHTGDGPIGPLQEFASTLTVTNYGSVPLTGAILCDKIDNMTHSLRPIGEDWYTGDQPAAVWLDDTTDPAGWRIEYASGPPGTIAPGYVQWDNDHLAGGLGLAGWYDSATSETQRNAGCEDDDGNWTADPLSFDPDPDQSLQKIRLVRAVPEPGAAIDLAGVLKLNIWLRENNAFFGGPHDGELIPSGVIIPNWGRWRTDQTNPDGGWYQPTYVSNNHTGGFDGDRLIHNRGFVRLSKWTISDGDATIVRELDCTKDSRLCGAATSNRAGEPIWFQLKPSVQALFPNPDDLTNVTVTDVLPVWLSFDRDCSAEIIAPYELPDIQNDTPAPGETTLTWKLGTVVANTDLRTINFCTDSDEFAPDGTNAVNRAVISSTEDSSSLAARTATAGATLTHIGEFRLEKTVDGGIDPEDNNQIYTLRWGNYSDFVTLAAPVLIDVFPHNLDESGENSRAPRSPGSDYSGALELDGPPTQSLDGDFLYTKRPPLGIDRDSTERTNLLPSGPDGNGDGRGDRGETIWCLASDFNVVAGCPAEFAEITAFMFRSAGGLGPGDIEHIDFTVNARGNKVGDLYANRFSAYTPTLLGQLTESNTVTVVVVGGSIGDLVFHDYDDDGIYEPEQGERPVADGLTINLLDGTAGPDFGTQIAQTTTADGRYLFRKLSQGDYYVEIPASELADGGPLPDYRPSAVRGVGNDDLNETEDQNANPGTDGQIITDIVGISWTAGAPDIFGNIEIMGQEPTDDDVAGIDPLADDRASNLTLDLGLVGPASIDLVKYVEGDDANTAPGVAVSAGNEITWTFEITNDGGQDLFDVTLTDDRLAAGAISCPDHLDDTDGDAVIDVLRAGQIVTCTATGTAPAGLYQNIARVTGNPVNDDPVDDDDPANVFGGTPAVDIEKATNGVDADDPTGPFIAVGDPVAWIYVVTNTGSADLRTVTVTDDQLDPTDISCADHLGDLDSDNVIDMLAPDDIVTCTATGIATPGQYANTGSVTGEPVDDDGTPLPDAEHPTDDDPSHYFGVVPSVDIEKSTNGEDADAAPGPFVSAEGPVNWTYAITNDGTATLTSVSVTDDRILSSRISCDDHRLDTDGDNTIDLLAPGESVACRATGIAVTGHYANVGTVTGQPAYPINPPADFDTDIVATYPSDPAAWTSIIDPTTETPVAPVADDDPSHYYGIDPTVDVEKATNGFDADDPTGPFITVGDPVTWTYTVTNTGNTNLDTVTVTDDQLDPTDISCAGHLGDLNTDNIIDVLGPDDIVTCTATGTATAGQYANTGTVTGTPTDDNGTPIPGMDPPTDDDPSHYFGADPSVDIEKSTNGVDADSPSGPSVEVGSVVTWTYTVTNDGNTPLAGVTITDDQFAPDRISCTDHGDDLDGDNVIDVLAPDDIVTCTATGAATVGQYANTGTVTGNPIDDDGTPIPGIDPPTDDDPSHYLGDLPQPPAETPLDPPVAAPTPYDLALSKTVDNSEPLPGAILTYTITVENRGPGGATGVRVIDQLPSALRFVGPVPSSGQSVTHNAATNQLVWSIGDLAAAESRRLSYTAVINDAVSDQEVIVNLARVEGDEPETDYTNNTDRTVVQTSRGSSTFLSFTGRSIAPALWTSLALILAGFAILVASRRRRTNSVVARR